MKPQEIQHFAGVEYRPVDNIQTDPRNARTHSKAQINGLVAAISAFGFVVPILVDETNRVLAGHGRLAAAKALGMSEIPVLSLQHLSEQEKRAFAIADNRLAELAGWDEQILSLEFEALLEIESTFDVTITGFGTAEIDRLVDAMHQEPDDTAEDVLPVDKRGLPICRPGDLFTLGDHRLVCGDAGDPEVFEALMGEERAALVITDPPYNVPIAGHVSGLGRIKHDEFVMASGELSPTQFAAKLLAWFINIALFSNDGAIAFVYMDWRHLVETITTGKRAFGSLKNLIVWAKSNAGMGSFYRSQHELVLAFKIGNAPHINNFELGQHGRHRSNVWTYAGANSFGADRDAALSMHPTVKPVAMIADAIRDCSHRGDIVLDPFLGSGTALIAAEKTGRRAYGLELDPRYVDVAVRRWQNYTGRDALHAETGLTFDQLAARRTDEQTGPRLAAGGPA